MSAPLRAVLFDLDGTLLDTAPEFHFVVADMLLRHGEAPVDYTDFRRSVSDGARGMVQHAFRCGDDDPRFETLRQELLALYAEHLAQHTQLFPGMAQTLEFIEQHGMAWGVVTNKPNAFAEPLLQKLHLRERCATLICPDHVKRRKPDPEALRLACEYIGCAVNEAVYVGDHRRDIEAARNAGMASIACSYGYVHDDDPVENWGADFIVHEARQIIPILRSWVY